MGLFEHFPFTNYQQLNLDWIFEKIKGLCSGFSELKNNFDSLSQQVNQAILKGFEKVGFTIPITQDGKNSFVVSKTDTPKPYNGTTTASFVSENHISIDSGRDTFIPTVVFDNEYSGNGFVEKTASGSDVSWTIFEGVKSQTIKSGDASGHCFTGGGELREVGPGGYNEFGIFCGEAHNNGSNNGLMEGVETFISDDNRAGSSYKTILRGIVSRVEKQNNNGKDCVCFLASSEGSYPAIAFDIFNAGTQIYDDGIKLINGNFKHHRAIRLPWGDAITYEQKGSENPLPVFHVDETGATMVESRGGAQAVYIRTGEKIFRAAFTPTVTTLYNSTGNPVFSVDSSGTLSLMINNQLRTISVNEQGQLIAQ